MYITGSYRLDARPGAALLSLVFTPKDLQGKSKAFFYTSRYSFMHLPHLTSQMEYIFMHIRSLTGCLLPLGLG